jgi:hypothetical protein
MFIDPYPAMTLDYTLESLKLQYGAKNVVHWRVSDRVGITVKHLDGDKPVSVTLTIEQAKYIAAHPLSIQDLVAERYPNGWPMSKSTRVP